MTSIFSTISGQFGKAWILGALLPTSLFVVLGLILVQPLLPLAWQVVGSPSELDTGGVLAVSFATLLLSGLLFHLNNPLIRFYEGYPWREGWLGQKRVRHYERRFDASEARWRGMRTLLRKMSDKQSDDYVEISKWRDRIGIARNRELPGEKALVLPTRLGNVIRSFEEYPRMQYGLDAIALWPHLLEVIDKDHAAAIEDEKVGFDFMLNMSFLLGMLGVATLYAGLADLVSAATRNETPWSWLVQLAAFAGLAYLAYLSAINRATGWGSAVRAAFETNRWTILRQLGYQAAPATLEAERDLWKYISQQVLRREDPSGPAAAYNIRTFVQGEPRGINLQLSRSVEPETTGHGVARGPRVVLSVHNADKRHATNVVVTDTLPDGFELILGSANLGGSPVEAVLGTNPYRFVIGCIAANGRICLTYEVLKHDSLGSTVAEDAGPEPSSEGEIGDGGMPGGTRYV
jgi:hypothetical protein